jgi:hypothetical protein
MASQTLLEETEEGLASLRQCLLPEERMKLYRCQTPWQGEYRYFAAENVVCIEHFRRPHTPAQRAGKFGWIDR